MLQFRSMPSYMLTFDGTSEEIKVGTTRSYEFHLPILPVIGRGVNAFWMEDREIWVSLGKFHAHENLGSTRFFLFRGFKNFNSLFFIILLRDSCVIFYFLFFIKFFHIHIKFPNTA